jgi:hypothetical protein
MLSILQWASWHEDLQFGRECRRSGQEQVQILMSEVPETQEQLTYLMWCIIHTLVVLNKVRESFHDSHHGQWCRMLPVELKHPANHTIATNWAGKVEMWWIMNGWMAAVHCSSTKSSEIRQLDGEKLKSKSLGISVNYLMINQATNVRGYHPSEIHLCCTHLKHVIELKTIHM